MSGKWDKMMEIQLKHSLTEKHTRSTFTDFFYFEHIFSHQLCVHFNRFCGSLWSSVVFSLHVWCRLVLDIFLIFSVSIAILFSLALVHPFLTHTVQHHRRRRRDNLDFLRSAYCFYCFFIDDQEPHDINCSWRTILHSSRRDTITPNILVASPFQSQQKHHTYICLHALSSAHRPSPLRFATRRAKKIRTEKYDYKNR